MVERTMLRRDFIAGSTLALAGLVLGCSRRSDAAAATGLVAIAEFSNDGKRLRLAQLPSVVKTDAEWRLQLPPLSYPVTRPEGTERAVNGPLLTEHRKGVFRCLCWHKPGRAHL